MQGRRGPVEPSPPAQALRTIGHALNSQALFDFRSAIDHLSAVVAGQPVHVVVDIQRHRRCTYNVTWSVTDSAYRVIS